MGVQIGWAWMHTIKMYKEAFNTAPPEWLKCLSMTDKIKLTRQSVKLRWPLPDVSSAELQDTDSNSES